MTPPQDLPQDYVEDDYVEQDYVEDAALKDGQTIHLRPIRPDDLQAMMDMWGRLSPETIRLRFFAPRKMEESQMHYFVDVDYEERFAMVAELHDRIVGVARFDRFPEEPQTAEFAVIVEDSQQGRGLGTVLLRSLMAPARDLGVTHFHGDILAENSSMLRVMRQAGFEPSMKSYGSTVAATFTTQPTGALLRRAGEEDRKAARAALSSVLSPASVAVIGASRDRRSVGGKVVSHLLACRFNGPVYLVNDHAEHVQSMPTYARLQDCPVVPETVFVCVPARAAIDVIDQAGRLGVRTAVVFAAGFGESGAAGQELERQLADRARSHGIRLLGPNCMGVANTAPGISLNASLSPVVPNHGTVALSSQSGALGMTILSTAKRLDVGLSSFASIGNKVDISSNDLLQFWETDTDTDVILLYLESFGNPRKFARLARRIGRTKPIVAVKSGRGDAGEVQALFDQAGVIRVETLDAMFNVARLLGHQPLPTGTNVAILSNGGGPAALAADACLAAGLKMASLSSNTVDVARQAGAYDTSPVTVHPTTDPEAYGILLSAIIADPAVDGVIAICIPPVAEDVEEQGRAISVAAQGASKPVAAVFMSLDSPPLALAGSSVPTYVFPESAAEAIAHAAHYAVWRERDLGQVVTFDDVDVPRARAVVEGALAGDTLGQTMALPPPQTEELLTAFGISTAPSGLVHDQQRASQVAGELGGVLVVKSAAPIQKADRGLVRLGLEGPAAVAQAVEQMTQTMVDAGDAVLLPHGWLVQRMVPDGVEVVVEVRSDPNFGPVLVVGLGGAMAELLGDVSMRIHPLTDVDVDDMLLQLKGYPMLTGYRGRPPVDVSALKCLLLRIAEMVERVPEIVSVDLNPVFVRRRGISVVDSTIRLGRGRRSRDPLQE